ncbi:hypothetical protein CTAYLR_009537 [Chrysophaeum taylorii]|uniref:Uncharacterized protein n=1 Tax=Chrysophaeum taylorii TaxID=2483200 RepID=A0AAD7UF89_9STRA|nr:hypothetical protein CTAYLR_009537 [Chrysophaeum taylorii]
MLVQQRGEEEDEEDEEDEEEERGRRRREEDEEKEDLSEWEAVKFEVSAERFELFEELEAPKTEVVASVLANTKNAAWPAMVAQEGRRQGFGKCGLLPEMECAWVGLGKTLVVWDYGRQDLAAYEGLSGPPTCACSAPAKSRVFEDVVSRVVAVATETELRLLALAYRKDGSTLELLPTEFVAPVDPRVELRAAVAAADGRVFFGGNDGLVHEFDYATRESWPARLTRLVFAKEGGRFLGYEGFRPPKMARRGDSRARRVVAAAFGDWFFEKDPVLRLAVDDVRGCLYALSDGGTLDAYALKDLKHVGRSSVVEAARRWCERRAQHELAAPYKPAKIVDLGVVSPFHSSLLHAVCVDESGTRYYYTTARERDLYWREAPPNLLATLSLVFVRALQDPLRIALAWESYGLAVMPARVDDDADKLFCCAHDAGVFFEGTNHHKVLGIAETSAPCKLRTLMLLSSSCSSRGVVSGLANEVPVPKKSAAAGLAGQRERKPLLARFLAAAAAAAAAREEEEEEVVVAPSSSSKKTVVSANGGAPLLLPEEMEEQLDATPVPEVAAQYLFGARRVAILTRAGVEEYARIWPIDQLRDLLDRGADVGWFAKRYGELETCCMALGIVVLRAPGDDQALKALALAKFKEIGTKATFTQQQQQQWFFGQPAPTIAFAPSTQYRALRLLVSRLARPVWSKPMVWSEGGRAVFLLEPSELAQIRIPVLELRALLKRDELFADATANDVLELERTYASQNVVVSWDKASAAARNAESARRETRETHKLYRFVSRLANALSLLDILRRARDAEDDGGSDQGGAVDARLKILCPVSLADLACSRDTHEKVVSCLRALTVPRWLDKRGTGYEWPEPLAAALGEACSSYFNSADATAQHGAARLRRAKELDSRQRWDEARAERLLARDFYLKAAAQWRSPNDAETALPVACDALLDANFAPAAVEVAVACARNFEEGDSSSYDALHSEQHHWELGLYRGGGGGGGAGSKKKKKKKKARDACYAIAADVARAAPHPAVLKAALSPTAAPEWFASQIVRDTLDRDERALLEVRLSTSLAKLLERQAPQVLWRHHLHWRRDAEASSLMERLATAPDLSLDVRIGYLVRAVEAARRAGLDDESRRLEEALELARLQHRCALATLDLARKATSSSTSSSEGGGGATKQELQAAHATLSSSLLPVSELYNDFASKFDHWDVCLAVMHATNQGDAKYAELLWRSILRRAVPLRSRDEETRAKLKDPAWWSDDDVMDDALAHLRSPPTGFFEDGDWIPPLVHLVSRLTADLGARSLDARGDARFSLALPLAPIVALLHKLGAEHSRFSSELAIPSWVLAAISPVPRVYQFLALRDIYRHKAEDMFEKFLALKAAADLLDSWSRDVANAPSERPLFAAAERRGARPQDILAVLDSDFDQPQRSPDLVQLKHSLHLTITRVDQIFRR